MGDYGSGKRHLRQYGNEVIVLLDLTGLGFLLGLDNDPVAGLRAMGTREVRHAHPCAEEAEDHQEGHQGLSGKAFQKDTVHSNNDFRSGTEQ